MTQKTIQELFNLTGKTAIVTGGAMGIGYGIVRRLAEAGANVVIADMDQTIGEQKAAEVKGTFIKTDVSSEPDVQNLIEQTVKKFGKLDILVHDAGIYPQSPVMSMDLAFWEKTQVVNLRGTFLCNREAAKAMLKTGGGNIINIGSVDSLHPSSVGLAAYDASKHGVYGFSKNFALEMGKQGIRVNVVAPGGITTEGTKKMMGTAGEEILKQFAAKIPMGRMGEPDDIAKAVLFLASDASAYMTGSIVVVDGGVLLN